MRDSMLLLGEREGGAIILVGKGWKGGMAWMDGGDVVKTHSIETVKMKQKKDDHLPTGIEPDVGVEPTTLRLRVSRSTD